MKALLWDLDDTVLNTLPARMAALSSAYETCVGGSIDPLEMWRSHRGGSLEALGKRLLGDDYMRFAESYRSFYYSQLGRAVPFPGVEDVLRTLREHGIQLAVVTSKISWGAIEELEKTGLLHLFGAVVGHDDVEHPKPDPEPIHEALNRLVVDDIDQVLFVGDSPADMLAARNAGCRSVAALWGTVDREQLLDTLPTYTAEVPSGVLDAVQSAMEPIT